MLSTVPRKRSCYPGYKLIRFAKERILADKSNLLVPLFEKDDCMDAGGRATHGAVAEGSGEIF